MKIFFSIMFLFFTSLCIAQKKKDNTISIDTSITLKDLKMILFKNGYTIDNTDTTFLSTSAKDMGGYVIKLNIARLDSSLILKGLVKMTVEMTISGIEIKEQFNPVFMHNVRSSVMGRAWKELNKIAEILGSKRLYYKE